MLGFGAALLIVYLVGFFNLETKQALSLYGKGMTKFLIHFAFLAAASRTSRAARALLLADDRLVRSGLRGERGVRPPPGRGEARRADLDALVLNLITGGAASLNIWGAVGESSVYRVNGLTGDANHLGVMLVVPLLMLTPLYLRLERGHRLKVPLAALLGFLLLVEIATLSRSGCSGSSQAECCSPSCTGRSS